MKKLLSILGAISLVATSGSYAVACGAKNNADSENENASVDDKARAEILTQYAKALFVNQNSPKDLGMNIGDEKEKYSEYHYSPSLYFEEAKSTKIKDLAFVNDINATYKKDSTINLSAAVSEYFDSNLVSNNLEANSGIYKGGVIGKDTGEMDSTLNMLLQTVTGFLGDPTKFVEQLPNLYKLVYGFKDAIKGFLTSDLKNQIKEILSNDVLKKFEEAFSPIKEGENYVSIIQSSVIDLANSFNGLLNKSDVVSDFDTASKSISKNIKALISGQASFSFDLTSIKHLPGIIKFVTVLLNYIDQYSYDDLTSKLIDKNTVLDNKTKVLEKGNVKNQFDIKKWLNVIDEIVNDNQKKGLTALKNTLGIIFVTRDDKAKSDDDEDGLGEDTQESFLNEEYSNKNEIYGKLLGDIAIEALFNGEKSITIEELGQTFYYSTLIKSLINTCTIYTNSALDGLLSALIMAYDNLPELLKNLIDSVGKENWSDFTQDILGNLYDNEIPNFISLKKAFGKPLYKLPSLLSSLFGGESDSSESEPNNEGNFDESKSYLGDFLSHKSIKEIVNDVKTNITNNYPTDSENPIKFSTLSSFFKSLYTDNTLSKALDSEDLLQALGLNSDGTVKSNSPFFHLDAFLKENSYLISGAIKLINKYTNDLKSEIGDIKKIFSDLRKDITVTYKISSPENIAFTASYGTIKNTFKIKLIDSNGKKAIASISL
ncbi:lipoprotein [Spiroplasma turonicum]|uniref:MOLPALP family lipoprotein n=1 Tax=Spiroplasma turonicum TaxID=216946 RepID=A0A0K1P706_9MOLU|nr:lipoprotein [Spiroplasma turonicum]AKU79667.1 hypothetical protein STURON_00421 [Spiroplasma turonicum]ALX70687.1 hypothetical protein STURO_v1c04190 [Spiroplasma turonicum]